MKDVQYLVGVRCFTYNQASYITDALRGFTMQQTTFPYIVMVVDDASTDGEQQVIMNYLDENFDIGNTDVSYTQETDYAHITFAQHKTNKNCYIVVQLLKENHYQAGRSRKRLEYLSDWRDHIKYEALCEGDDYWTDSLKLQKQVDFLENNPEYGMCFHAAKVVLDKCNLENDLYSFLENKDYTIKEIISEWIVPTCSVVYRANIKDRVPRNKKFAVGDNVLFCTCAINGKIRCINQEMGCYRRNISGWTNQSNEILLLKMINHYDGMIEAFPEINKNIFEDVQIRFTFSLFRLYLVKKDVRALSVLYQGLKKHRFRFIIIVIKRFFINISKKR